VGLTAREERVVNRLDRMIAIGMEDGLVSEAWCAGLAAAKGVLEDEVREEDAQDAEAERWHGTVAEYDRRVPPG